MKHKAKYVVGALAVAVFLIGFSSQNVATAKIVQGFVESYQEMLEQDKADCYMGCTNGSSQEYCSKMCGFEPKQQNVWSQYE